jgi:hypothetical protein
VVERRRHGSAADQRLHREELCGPRRKDLAMNYACATRRREDSRR